MPKFGIAKSTDLTGPTNPTGILSPAFLMLKQALDKGDTPENVTQAFYDWLAQRRIKPAQVDQFLDLEPDQAFSELIKAIGGGLVHDPAKGRELPPLVVTTLKKALAHIAGKHVLRSQQELDVAQGRLSRIKSRFAVESAQEIVASLLD